MRWHTRLVSAFSIGVMGLFSVGMGPVGQAQDATPPSAHWHVHIVDLYGGDPEATEKLIDAELAALDQHCIDRVEFFSLGRNQSPAIAIVLRC